MLGTNPPNKTLLFVFNCPVGLYHRINFNVIRLLVTTEYVRGTREARIGGNYAHSSQKN